jgi:4-hydroxybenzoate polyprenyltransferase
MKRVTYWPQFFLGLTLNWGALMGYSAIANQIDAAALALYAAGLFWTLGYDTIYAHQDNEDDALIGVKSSALKLGRHTRTALVVFYASTLICLALAGGFANMQTLYWAGLAISAYHLLMQIMRLDIDNPDTCLRIFRANRDTGLIIAGTILLGAA